MEAGKRTVPTRGVPVDLGDGIERRLRYTFATRRAMVEEFGGEAALATSLSGDKLCKVLWYGLKHEDTTLTVDIVEELVDLENVTDIINDMMRAMGYKGATRVEIAPEASGAANPPTAAPGVATGAL